MTNFLLVIIILLFSMIIMSVSFYYMQNFSNKNIFYGVNIPKKYRDYDELKKSDKYYKKSILLLSFTSLFLQVAFYIAASYCENKYIYILSFYFPILFLSIASFIVYLKTYKAVLSFKKEFLSTIDKELDSKKVQIFDINFLKEKEKLIKKYRILCIIPILITFLITLYIILNYNKIPNMMPVHYNYLGVADKFIEKNVSSFLFQLSYPLIMMIILYFSIISSLKSRIKMNDKNSENFSISKLKYLEYLAFSSFIMLVSMSILLNSISLALLFKSLNIVINITTTVLILFSIIPIIYFSIKIKNNSSSDSSYSVEDDDEHWILGSIYYNKNDPSAFTSKRFGIGWTVNLGNIKGKSFCILILLFVFWVVFFSIKYL
ncbi:DUF5808 domain-containing protein [Peptacetobacter sp.]|uniref:DUF5808 domain-containing protein n=1 Tax=Peptacetobacter sp. TaxID=2991975 RepID=UPI002607BEB9|nr:DUF5808 domain-containing protein [Peptacetobacter sp.]